MYFCHQPTNQVSNTTISNHWPLLGLHFNVTSIRKPPKKEMHFLSPPPKRSVSRSPCVSFLPTLPLLLTYIFSHFSSDIKGLIKHQILQFFF
jgi:hypothetical protein